MNIIYIEKHKDTQTENFADRLTMILPSEMMMGSPF